MIYLKLTTNEIYTEHQSFVVSKKHLHTLHTLKKTGGYKRFNIDVIDSKLKAKPVNYINLISWLSLFVFGEKSMLPLKAMFMD